MPSQKLREFAKEYFSENAVSTAKNDLFLTEEEIALLPSNKQKIGDISIVSIPAALSHKKEEIGKLLLLADKNTRLVLNDSGIQGQYRIPNREIIGMRFSDPALQKTETIHKENSCQFKLDVSKIMFSKGNLEEKRRFAANCSDETVVDMFAGIGYFSIPAAVHSKPKKVISIE